MYRIEFNGNKPNHIISFDITRPNLIAILNSTKPNLDRIWKYDTISLKKKNGEHS